METIKAWSNSRLVVFEQCKRHAKLKFLDKIPEPERTAPAGIELPNVRGGRIHNEIEHFIRDNGDFPIEAIKFEPEIKKLKELYKEGKVSLEEDWGFDEDWNPVKWSDPNIWVRIKLDAFVFLSPTHGVVIDYKTGKRFNNEFKHADQCRLYQLAAFLRYPKLQQVDVELWYLDVDYLDQTNYTREFGTRLITSFNNRGLAMTAETEFPANPNKISCRYCPYGRNGNSFCDVGV